MSEAIDNGIEFTGLVQRGDKAINERYRPQTFHEVIGNDATKKALQGWMERGDKRSRALLFTGSPGTGKTTLARILAMGLNCEHGDTVNPCCECPSCKAAMAQEAMHIVECNMSSLSKKEDADDIVNSMYNSSFTGRNNVYILDECLHYSTMVDCLVDGNIKRIPIGQIVKKKMNLDVLSYNETTMEIEAKPIVNWFENPKKEVYEWVFDRVVEPNMTGGRKVLTCTDNHTVFLRDENLEVKIGELKPGDVIRGNEKFFLGSNHLSAILKGRGKYVIDEKTRQFVLGNLLGDGSLSKSSENGHTRICGIHCEKQKFYALEKARIFGDAYASGKDVENSGYARVNGEAKKAFVFRTKSIKEFDEFYELFDRKKYQLSKILEQLDEIGIAVWYMDDGSLISNKTTVNLSTHDFSEEENNLIIEFFNNKYNIHFKKILDKRVKKYFLYCTGENKDKFLKLVSPYVLTEFQYKCGRFQAGDKLRTICPILYKSPENQQISMAECGYRFVEKRLNPKKNNRGHVYDIEVADNHNYFASGINVHNCQGMSTGSQNLMLKMLENPPARTYVILATTDPQKILKTVKTRCEQYEIRNPGAEDIKKMLSSVVKQELPSMTKEQRIEIYNACQGLGFREILMKLEKFIKGGGSGSLEEAFQADYMGIAKAVLSADYQSVLEQISKCGESFDVEAARRLTRTFLCNQIEYFLKNGDGDKAKRMLAAFRVFDKGFYTDPNPLPSFKADLFEACLMLSWKQ